MKTHTYQCDSCAFRISESQAKLEDDRAVEQKYTILRGLKNSPPKYRAISVSIGIEKTEETDKTETCFLNSPLWPSKVKVAHCPDRIDDCVSLETALKIRASFETNVIASEATRWAKWAVFIAIVAAIISANEHIVKAGLMIIGTNPP